MSFCIVSNYFADQGGVTDWGKSRQVTDKNAKLFALTVTNKGADCWVQIYDWDGVVVDPGVGLTFPLPAGSVFSLTERKFANGIYVDVTTDAEGNTQIGSNDVKIDAQFMTHPCID